MAEKTNHYRTLGLSPDADEKEIRAAYRALAKRYHPDAGEGSSAERFRAVQDAYDLLSDAEKRRDYDQSRIEGPRIPIRHPARCTSRPAHIDLREITRPQDRARARDPLEEAFEFLFWDF